MSTIYENARVPRLLIGVGALDPLPGELARCHTGSVLLVADPGVAATGVVDRLDALLAGVLPVHRTILPPGEPTAEGINAAAALARTLPKPVVIGVGGGSALDTAKLVAAMAAAEHGVEHYLLCAHPYAGKRPSVMIPTTSGTGAEVTRTAICADAQGRKLWAWGEELLPELVVLDPSLTATLPPALTAATGLDAFTHALEAYTAQRRNRFAEAAAMQAMRLIVQHLPRAVAVPGDLAARQAMQEAAALAGIAIDNCGTGVAHTLGHALGTLYHLPHGVAVTLGLQAAIRWNLVGNEAIFDEVATAFGPGFRAADVPACLAGLLTDVRFDDALERLRHVRIDVGALTAASLAEENAPMRKNNVRIADEAAIAFLAQQLAEDWQAEVTV